MKQLLMIITLLLGSLAAYPHDSIEVVIEHLVKEGQEGLGLSIKNNNSSKIIILYDNGILIDQHLLSYYMSYTNRYDTN